MCETSFINRLFWNAIVVWHLCEWLSRIQGNCFWHQWYKIKKFQLKLNWQAVWCFWADHFEMSLYAQVIMSLLPAAVNWKDIMWIEIKLLSDFIFVCETSFISRLFWNAIVTWHLCEWLSRPQGNCCWHQWFEIKKFWLKN